MAVFKSLESPLIPLFSSSPHQSSSHPVDLQLLHPGPSHHHLSPVWLYNPTGPSASTLDHTIHCALSSLSLFHSLKDTRAYVSPPTAMQQCLITLRIKPKFFFFPLVAPHVTCGILIPQPGIECMPPAVEEPEAQSLNH